MTALARLILRQRAAVILFALILLVAGGVTATRMQEELLPNVSFNTVTVVTVDPGASPDTVLKDVTKPVEVAVAGVPGINTLASTSAQNASVVVLRFNYGTDINQAESKISTAVSALPFPAGVQAPKVSTVDLSAFPILYLGVNNRDSKATLQDTYRLVNSQVKPQLEQLSGVAAADVGGGASPRITVTLNPAKLARYGVTPAQVTAILQANNVGIPGGNVTANGVTQPVVTTGSLTTLKQIAALPSGGRGARGRRVRRWRRGPGRLWRRERGTGWRFGRTIRRVGLWTGRRTGHLDRLGLRAGERSGSPEPNGSDRARTRFRRDCPARGSSERRGQRRAIGW